MLGRSIFLSRSAVLSLASGAPESRALLGHELAHVEQFRRLGILRFLLRYVGEYARSRVRGASHSDAYRSISLEREAERGSQS